MNLVGLVLCLVSLFISVGTSPTPKPSPVCGYDACPNTDPNSLNVHLVPHSHDDVGWLKTVDQYYYGSKQNIQNAGVQYILDSVIAELAHDRTKRFIYVETAFLWKWWMEQHDTTRHLVQKLVKNGQLEIISGGWAMNDEAVTHYQSTIDQLTWGFRKLNDTFGACGRPHIGWQIDPFGHSREQASIFAQMGFDGLFIGRLDYQDKKLRLSSKTPEMIWQGSPINLGKKGDLFTHVLYNNYSPPPGFCFDLLCDGEPIIDSKRSRDYNVPQKVDAFLKYVNHQAKSYDSNNIILTMGMDFHFQAAHVWFKNMDKLIRYVNNQKQNGSKVNVFYSSPSCYLKAVHDSNNSFVSKQDDFFPYADGKHSFWTGYFTSKPTLKYFERLGNNYLQVCKQLYAITDLGPEDWVDLNRMREAMGILQHHDAITGTAKEHVVHDYALQLSQGFEECDVITGVAINKLFGAHTEEKTIDSTSEAPPPPSIPLESCLLLNISQCAISETSKSFVVTLYNPLARPVSHYVRLPVASKSSYTVQDPSGAKLAVQMVPIPHPVIDIPGRKSSSEIELVFRAEQLPPLGFRSYYVTASKHLNEAVLAEAEDTSELPSEHLTLNVSPAGEVRVVHANGVSTTFTQKFGYYHGYVGNNSDGDRASGAYIFRPNGSEPRIVQSIDSKVYKGSLVKEIHQTFEEGWISQVVRLYAGEAHLEFVWQVGPIPISEGDWSGKEVITRYITDMKTDGVFYTDSNGREMIKRVRNYRPTWKVDLKENVSGNYYPVTTRIRMSDKVMQQDLAVLTDRAEGGSSLADGQIELMLHRRLLVDDNLGVAEPLNETRFGVGLVARGRHYILVSRTGELEESPAAEERLLVQEKLLQPWVFLSRADSQSFTDWKTKYKMEYSGLTKALPPNIHLLTLEPWKGRAFLVRLEHALEKKEDPKLSKPAIVNLKNLFSSFSIVSARETTLGGNQWLKDSRRLQWRTEVSDLTNDAPTDEIFEDVDPQSVTLEPMQIRTFIVDIKAKGLDFPF